MIAAREDIAVFHGNIVVILRPSLRATSLLERLHDGWPNLLRKVEQFDTATIQAIIRTAATDRSAAEVLLASLRNRPLSEIGKAVSDPLRELLTQIMQPEDQDEPAPAGEPLPWSEAFSRLFEIGTGWLSWTPATTWGATPAEISAAMRGHMAQLRAIHGGDDSIPSDSKQASTVYSPQKLQQIEEQGFDPAFDREGLRALKAKYCK